MLETGREVTNPYYTYSIFYQSERFSEWEDSKPPAYREYRRQWMERPIFHDHGLRSSRNDARYQENEPFPLHLNIELTTRCNLACTFCTQPTLSASETGDLSWAHLTQALDEGADHHTLAVNFNGLGEPTLIKRLPEIIRYAKDLGYLDIMFHTNGTAMTPHSARELIKSGLDRIIFSVDSPDKQTYESMRIGSKFEHVLSNVRLFSDIRSALDSLTPMIRATMVVTEKTFPQIPAFVKLWKPIADQITTQDLTWRSKAHHSGIWNNGERSALSNDFDEVLSEATERGYTFSCPYLYQSTYIFFNGDIIPCSNPNARKHMVMSKLSESTIESAWTNAEYTKLRDLHSKGEWYKHPVCRNCEVPLIELSKAMSQASCR